MLCDISVVYTPCLKKLCIFIFVRTSSNFHQIVILFGVYVVNCLKFYAVYALPPYLTHVTA